MFESEASPPPGGQGEGRGNKGGSDPTLSELISLVGKHGSVTAAAIALGCSKQALSKRIKLRLSRLPSGHELIEQYETMTKEARRRSGLESPSIGDRVGGGTGSMTLYLEADQIERLNKLLGNRQAHLRNAFCLYLGLVEGGRAVDVARELGVVGKTGLAMALLTASPTKRQVEAICKLEPSELCDGRQAHARLALSIYLAAVDAGRDDLLARRFEPMGGA